MIPEINAQRQRDRFASDRGKGRGKGRGFLRSVAAPDDAGVNFCVSKASFLLAVPGRRSFAGQADCRKPRRPRQAQPMLHGRETA